MLSFAGITCLGLALIFGGLAWRDYKNARALQSEPGTMATVLSLSPPARRGVVRGVIEFSRTSPEGLVHCRIETILGDRSAQLHVGQQIRVVPRRDSCGEPAISTYIGFGAFGLL